MKYLAIFFCLLMLGGCYRDEAISGQWSDEFYVSHEGADFPVWVRGNKESGVFILYIHGGPGGSSLRDAIGRTLRDLEEKYAVVYFDQRISGYAHGKRTAKDLTVDQMVEDVDVILEFIRFKYAPESFFLFGHSWGGYLGTAYLLEHQEKINGWIEGAGAHNFPLTMELEIAYVTAFAQAEIAANSEDKEYWQEALNWLRDNPDLNTLDKVLKVNSFAQRADGKKDEESAYEPPAVFAQFTAPVSLGSSQELIINQLEDVILNGNLNPQMGTITTPALFIYAEYDAVVPKGLAQNGYDFIGTPPEDKSIVIMQRDGHALWEVEPQLFAQAVSGFVEAYK